MTIDQLEKRSLLMTVIHGPYSYVANRVLYVISVTGTDETAVTVRDGVAKFTITQADAWSAGGQVDHRQTIKSRKGQVFDRVVVDLGFGDDIASIISDIPVTVRGGVGNDRITISAKHSSVFGDAGNDALISAPPLLTNEPEQSISRNVGRSTMVGKVVDMIEPTYNVIEGNAGDDRIETRGGDDEVHGGAGRDTLVKLNSDIRVKSGAVDAIGYIPESRIVLESRVGTFSVEAISATIASNPVLVLYNRGLDNGFPGSIYPVAPKKR